jgi:hypothetical protein
VALNSFGKRNLTANQFLLLEFETIKMIKWQDDKLLSKHLD